MPLERLFQLEGSLGKLCLAVGQQALDGTLDLRQSSALWQGEQREIVLLGELVRGRRDRSADGQRPGA